MSATPIALPAGPGAVERLAVNAGCVALIALSAALASAVLVAARIGARGSRRYSNAALLSATPWPPRRRTSGRSPRVRPPIA